ncbi:MAG: preprotein translocase subunit YajC [Bacteroidota bacterium]
MNLSSIPLQQIVLFGSIFVVFYFFMMRPQQRRQREQQAFLEKIKKGQSVVTVGGIHGKIHEVVDDLVTLETDSKGSKIIFSKSAISIESTQNKYAQKRKS